MPWFGDGATLRCGSVLVALTAVLYPSLAPLLLLPQNYRLMAPAAEAEGEAEAEAAASIKQGRR